MKKLTVYLALELNYLRTSIREQLRGFHFVQEVKSIKKLNEISKHLSPGVLPVLLVDSSVVNQNKETISRLLNELPEELIVLVFVTNNEDDLKFYQQIQVDDYIYFNTEIAEIEKKFKRIAVNSISTTKIEEEVNWKKLSRKTGLTVNALKVLKLICEGYTSKQIGDKLCRSKRTIDGHRRTLYQKTGTKTLNDLLMYALKHDLFPNVFV